jgi:hypothetical protein
LQPVAPATAEPPPWPLGASPPSLALASASDRPTPLELPLLPLDPAPLLEVLLPPLEPPPEPLLELPPPLEPLLPLDPDCSWFGCEELLEQPDAATKRASAQPAEPEAWLRIPRMVAFRDARRQLGVSSS